MSCLPQALRWPRRPRARKRVPLRKRRTHAAARHPRGSYTQTTQTQRTANGHTTNTVRTDAQGRTSTRDATVVNDKDAGTRTKDVTFTGKDGETRTADTVTQRTDDGYTRDTTYTDKNGNTATREADVVRDAETHTTTKTVTVDRTPAPVIFGHCALTPRRAVADRCRDRA